MQADYIRDLILGGLPAARVTVTGDGQHFEAIVIAAEFSGKSTVERHRMVYRVLGDRVGNEIHALSLRTLAPEERSA